ncbi:MAG: efflux RND transporter periplasmic adaptor subunit [Phascolarctobacterium sp.]|nr:efflux RND transporter periplasmic adaptor subunit [Acidaminococcaceae bacterium]MBQ7883403.1 efflux RND transporter periplasmic adaptor subunit [Phascolarctobacterium sp.]
MFSFIRSRHAKKALAAAMAATMILTVAGCAKKEQQAGPQATLVKTMKVITRTTPIVYDYTGFVEATQEMTLSPQVTGQIVGKYFKGGDTVQEGQVLYKIDPRTYQANLLSAEGNLASARANLANAEMDAERYTKLYEQNAVSKQMMDNAVTARDQARASVKAMEGLLLNAQINMEETNVVAPFTGRTDTSSLEVGNYVVAGQGTLTKISNTDPVFVKFSIAEPEYLTLAATTTEGGASLDNLTAVLANGETYDLKGQVSEVNRGISDNTGTLTIKATFQNPTKKLLPGMFAHIQATAGVRENALLIPQRSVTEMMYKNFVYVVGEDNKVIMKEVTVGQNVGRLVMVNSGLNGEETLVVEGVGKMRQGVLVAPQPMTEADLNTQETK